MFLKIVATEQDERFGAGCQDQLPFLENATMMLDMQLYLFDDDALIFLVFWACVKLQPKIRFHPKPMEKSKSPQLPIGSSNSSSFMDTLKF
jgi:hypothetical protein